MDKDQNLLVPLPLSEMLFVTLGTMMDGMPADHPWRPTVAMVLRAYVVGRDDHVEELYGPEVAREMPVITEMVADTVADWLEREASTTEDFEKWKEELDEHFFGEN